MYNKILNIVYNFLLVSFFYSIFLSSNAIASYNFIKLSNNPIFSVSPEHWDKSSTHAPSVIKDVSDYKMWYEGNAGQGWRIGYAHSLDGISNWTRYSQPVIPIGSNDGFEMDTLNPNVIYNPDLGKYQMWYTSLSSNWTGGPDRFRVRYASSDDGLNWTRYDGFVLRGSDIPNSWDSGGIARGISVIYKDHKYHMWYSGTDWGFNFKIGYATSLNGIDWVKMNSGNPVLVPTNSWDLAGVNFPTVVSSNGIFEMIYGGSHFDVPVQFNYATSSDGIIWSTSESSNPILTIGSTGAFDSNWVTGPSFMKTQTTAYLWYGGNSYSIGLATDSNIPTQTPTPIPSPTPPPKKKIIIVPGLGGSWNREALVGCTESPSNGNWTRTLSYYTDLQNKLQSDNLDTLFFAYDWRRPVPENGLKLKQFIDSHTEVGEKVYIVGHSMGGLIARSYLEHEQSQNKIEKLLTVGSPHSGSNLAYPALAAGKSWSANKMMTVAFTLLQATCKFYKGINSVDTIRTTLPSFYDILPVYNYLTDKKSNTEKSVSSMYFQNRWLPTPYFQFPFYNALVGALSGTGFQTHERYLTNPPTKSDLSKHIWTDGFPTQKRTTNAGDGTVLNISSYVPGAQNWTILQSHGGLTENDEGIQEISHFFTPSVVPLNAQQPRNQQKDKQHEQDQEEKMQTIVVVSESGNFTVIDPKGNSTSDTEGIALITDPKKGTYRITLTSQKPKTMIFVGRLLPNDETVWKEFKIERKGQSDIRFEVDNEDERQEKED